MASEDPVLVRLRSVLGNLTECTAARTTCNATKNTLTAELGLCNATKATLSAGLDTCNATKTTYKNSADGCMAQRMACDIMLAQCRQNMA